MNEHWKVTHGRRWWGRTVMEGVETLFVLTIFLTRHASSWQYEDTVPRMRESLEGWPAGVQKFTGLESESNYFKELRLDGDFIVIGAKNYLYNISADTFTQVMSLRWDAPNHIIENCQDGQRTLGQCQNYIRVVTKTNNSQLLVCGTHAYKPMCRVYNIEPKRYNKHSESSGIGRCPYDPEHNSTAVYAGGKLYAATSIKGESLIYSQPLRTVSADSLWLNDPDFVGSFEHGDKVYFFFRESALEYINCGKAVFSRVARICKNDQGGKVVMTDTWTSYFKTRLNCSIPGEYPFYFDEIQSMSMLHDGNYQPSTANKSKILYAVFRTPSNSIRGSAVCAFRMEDIEKAFEGTFKHQETVKSNWLPVGSDKIPNPHPAQSCQESKSIPIEPLNFIKKHPLMDESVQAYGGAPVFVHTGFNYRLTQIAIDWQFLAADGRNYDIIFAGTDDGVVIKAINAGVGDKIVPVTIEEIRVFKPGTPITSLKVHRQANRPESTAKLIIMTTTEVRSIALNRCNKHHSCSECLRIQDPYCAWSPSQKTCVSGQNGAPLIQNIEFGQDSRCDGLPDGFRPNSDDGPYIGVIHTNMNQQSTTPAKPTCAPCRCPKVPRRSIPPSKVEPTPTPDIIRKHTNMKTEKPVPTDKEGNNILKPDPKIGSQVGTQTGLYTATSMALAIVFSIILSLAVGFLAGFFYSVKRNQGLHKNFSSPPALNDIGTIEKNKNVYVEPPVKNVENNIQGKQVNVTFDPYKPNNKLPNGGADIQVSPKKVYL